MPIYAYRCAACGHAKDVLQKLSDATLTTCPACGAERFEKQVTAAGFQLKGSGWYVTDFRDSAKKPADKAAAPVGDKPVEGAAGDKAAQAKDGAKPEAAPAPTTAAPAAAPAAAAPPPASTSS
jgi:putative FmdB family regulatory protein